MCGEIHEFTDMGRVAQDYRRMGVPSTTARSGDGPVGNAARRLDGAIVARHVEVGDARGVDGRTISLDDAGGAARQLIVE